MKIWSGCYTKSNEKPNDVVLECENYGCKLDCVFYGGKKSEEEFLYSPIHNQYYKLTTVSHVCLKIDDFRKWREAIYTKADIAWEAIPFTFGQGVTAACRKKREVFEEIIEKEYRQGTCPCYRGTLANSI